MTAATAANPMNRRAHTATPTSRLPEIVLGDLQVVGDGALDAEGAIRFLEGSASFGQLLEAVSNKIEQTKLGLVEEIAAEGDLILRVLAPPPKCANAYRQHPSSIPDGRY